MTSDSDKFQPEPAEGDRATIERELKRAETKRSADKRDRETADDNRPVKDFAPSSPGRRMFGNGDTDRGT